MFGNYLKKVRTLNPLVHNITNYVTVNDCANLLIASGASPIMADALEEMENIVSISQSLNINLGTLNERTVASMLQAGRSSNQKHHPIILDPVGVGASSYRTNTANHLLEQLSFSVIRGNLSEIKALALSTASTKGVDANENDSITNNNLDSILAFAQSFSKQTGAVIAITGAIDVVVDAKKAFVIRNGHAMMSKISGTGCMLSALIAAYVGANPEQTLQSCAAAVCAMGICGERAYARLQPNEGNLTYKTRIFDEMFHLTPEILEKGASYEIR